MSKISWILLGLGLVSGSMYAGHAEEISAPVSNDINVTAPDQTGVWSFGAMVVLMQPTNKDFIYAGNFLPPAVDSAGDAELNLAYPKVTEDYDWWFGADISYAFPGNGRNVTLAYEGLHGTDSDSTTNADFGNMHSSFSGGAFTYAEGETDTDYDAGDLLFGQKLDVGQRIQLHPFVGLRYAHLDLSDTASYTGGRDGNDSQVEYSKIENTFNGVGPRFGADAQINLGQGFSIRGRLGLSALIGSHAIDSFITQTDYMPNGTVDHTGTGKINLADYSETRVVPEIDGRLGVNYTYNFNSNKALGFELGWQAMNYFNVVSSNPSLGDIGAAEPGTNSHAGPGTIYDTNQDFGLQGPYARVQLDLA